MALMPVCSGSLHGLPAGNARSGLDSTGRVNCVTMIGPLPSIGTPSGLTTRLIKRIAHRDAKEFAGAADFIALGDFLVFAKDDDADGSLFEVERQAAHTRADELDHLAGHDVRQAVDTRDAVADLQDAADLASDGFTAELVNFRLQN